MITLGGFICNIRIWQEHMPAGIYCFTKKLFEIAMPY